MALYDPEDLLFGYLTDFHRLLSTLTYINTRIRYPLPDNIEDIIKSVPEIYKTYFNIDVTPEDLVERPFLVYVCLLLRNANKYVSNEDMKKLLFYDLDILNRVSNIFNTYLGDILILIITRNFSLLKKLLFHDIVPIFQPSLNDFIYNGKVIGYLKSVKRYEGDNMNHLILNIEWIEYLITGVSPASCSFLSINYYNNGKLGEGITYLTIKDRSRTPIIFPSTLISLDINELINTDFLNQGLLYLTCKYISCKLPDSIIYLNTSDTRIIFPKYLQAYTTQDISYYMVDRLPTSLTYLRFENIITPGFGEKEVKPYDLSYLTKLRCLRCENCVNMIFPTSLIMLDVRFISVDISSLVNLKIYSNILPVNIPNVEYLILEGTDVDSIPDSVKYLCLGYKNVSEVVYNLKLKYLETYSEYMFNGNVEIVNNCGVIIDNTTKKRDMDIDNEQLCLINVE